MLALRVQRILAGMSRALRRNLPVSLRRAGKGMLGMEWSTNNGVCCAIARWEGSDSVANDADVFVLAKEAASQLGEFPGPADEVLANWILAELQSGQISLPEFLSVGANNAG